MSLEVGDLVTYKSDLVVNRLLRENRGRYLFRIIALIPGYDPIFGRLFKLDSGDGLYETQLRKATDLEVILYGKDIT